MPETDQRELIPFSKHTIARSCKDTFGLHKDTETMTTLTLTPTLDTLPEALNQIGLRHLLVMKLESTAPTVVGQTPTVFRRVGLVPGGSFES